MQALPDGTILAFRSYFKLRHLFTKPLHYVIQIATGSPFHHVGIMCLDFYEALASGVRKIKLDIDRIKLEEDLESQLGKKYSVLQAMFSAIDRFFLFGYFKIKPTNKETFCSKYCFYAYLKIVKELDKEIYEILNKYVPKTISPDELIKLLLKVGLIDHGITIKKAKK